MEFQEEESITFDVGIKAAWLERRLLTNLTVFRTELEAFQAVVLNPDPNIPGFIVGNAGDQIVRGFEFEIVARPAVPLTLRATGAYMDAKFENFTGVGGVTPSQTPETTWSASADWAQPVSASLEWFLRVEYGFTDEQILGGRVNDSFGITNVRGGLRSEDGRWAVTAWGKNVTDETYYVAMANMPAAGFVSGGGFAGGRGGVAWYGAPRAVGVSLTYRLQ